MVERTVAEGVTLQVNVAPSDLPYAEATLRHHLRQWGSQVSDVIYTLDLHKSAGPRGDHYENRKVGMQRLVDALARCSDSRRVLVVDYGPAAAQRVGRMFFGGAIPPVKDCFGAPFYGYFYGLSMVQSRYVLHVDCDMLFGGGSGIWLREATQLLQSRPEVLFVCPLAGPPTPDARIPRRVRRAQMRTQEFGSEPVLERQLPRTYRLRHVSSRVFFVDLTRLREIGPFTVMRAPPWTYGSDLATTPFLPAETVLSRAMHDKKCLRLDYLGTEPGMWFVHPGQRGSAFVENLPNLIAALEKGEIVAAQRGSYELRDEWLNSVGPARVERPPSRVTPRATAKWLARATGVLALRLAVQQARWRRWKR